MSQEAFLKSATLIERALFKSEISTSQRTPCMDTLSLFINKICCPIGLGNSENSFESPEMDGAALNLDPLNMSPESFNISKE
ncbi:MAG: hypothetical protein ABFC86_06775, partial [Rectinema sp.]